MATAPQKRTKNTWILLGVLALIAIVWLIYATIWQPSEEVGGSLSAGDTNYAAADSTYDGPDPAGQAAPAVGNTTVAPNPPGEQPSPAQAVSPASPKAAGDEGPQQPPAQ